MKIEEGKVYKRRDGLKAFDVKIKDGIAYYYFERDGNIRSAVVFESSGSLSYDAVRFPFSDDLIEEWKEEKMPRFKVGDRVDSISGLSFDKDWQNVAIHKIKSGIWVFNELKLVTQPQKSPVVEKKVKSIEPGVYGIVTVGKIMSHGETVQVDLDKISKDFGATAEELESAAKTFMELAEYLRERG